jgi:hypothetical protein
MVPGGDFGSMDRSGAADEPPRHCVPPTRGFHRLGVAIAAATMATGLAFVGAAVTRLELVELLSADTFAIVLGSALVVLGVIAIGAYGVVRAIERFSR